MRQSLPTDWVLTLSDHGRLKMLVEIRENGRLVLRRWLSHDDVFCDNGVTRLIHEVTSPYFDPIEEGRR